MRDNNFFHLRVTIYRESYGLGTPYRFLCCTMPPERHSLATASSVFLIDEWISLNLACHASSASKHILDRYAGCFMVGI